MEATKRINRKFTARERSEPAEGGGGSTPPGVPQHHGREASRGGPRPPATQYGSRERDSGSVERRVVEAALELAARGGFDAVRQRDVAERAGVALGTLYKRFPSKDELLIGVLEAETQKLSSRLEREPPPGDTPLERVGNYFAVATYYFVRKPRLGSAVVRAAASGERISARLMKYHAQQLQGVVNALRPEGGNAALSIAEADAVTVATILLQVWFSALVGWSGGLFDPDAVVEQVRVAARLVLLGIG